jgi:RimJ/RimL family protein N-acetyltransferase
MYQIDNIKLIPFTEEMISDKYLSWFNNPEICRYTSHCRYPMTKSNAIKYCQSINSPYSSSIVWAIMFQGNHVGNIALTSIDKLNNSAEIAIIIGEEVRSRGIGTKVVAKIIEHAFNRLNINRVWLGTSSENIKMQKVATNVGMKIEGVLEKALFINGEYSDSMIFAILKNNKD